jgi:hypothetical protein
VPQSAKGALFKLDTFSKNLLPSAERLRLPAPKDIIEDGKIGRTVFSSIKRVLYKSLCDKDSDIYKAWFNNGMELVLNKKYIAVAVAQALTGIGIGIGAIAISVVALIMKFGIEVYCDRYKALGVMEIR